MTDYVCLWGVNLVSADLLARNRSLRFCMTIVSAEGKVLLPRWYNCPGRCMGCCRDAVVCVSVGTYVTAAYASYNNSEGVGLPH